MQLLIVDKLSETILDASTDEVLLVEIDTDDLDLVESIVNNWGPEAVEKAAKDLGWRSCEINALRVCDLEMYTAINDALNLIQNFDPTSGSGRARAFASDLRTVLKRGLA